LPQKFRMVKIIDQLLCLGCDFSETREICQPRSGRKMIFYCRRLDCDNWLTPGFRDELEVILDNDWTI